MDCRQIDWRFQYEVPGIVLVPAVAMAAFPEMAGNPLTEFLIIILPQYFLTVCPRMICPLLLCLIGISVYRKRSLQGIRPDGKFSTAEHPGGSPSKQSEQFPWLTIAMIRTMLMIPVSVTIMACDFCNWTDRLGKTETVGFGLMDIGVMSFLTNAGVLSGRLRKSSKTRSSLYMILLGFVRLAVVWLCGLHVSPWEYGAHLNIYFLFGLLGLLFQAVDSRYNGQLAVGLLGFHVVAESICREAVLSENRRGLLMANKEGVLFLAPYLGFYLLFNYFGRLLFLLPADELVWQWLRLTGQLLEWYLAVSQVELPSRRTCNLSFFLFSGFANGIFVTTAAVLARVVPERVGLFRLSQWISRRALELFLGTNLLILGAKLAMDSEACGSAIAHLVNICYLAASFILLPMCL